MKEQLFKETLLRRKLRLTSERLALFRILKDIRVPYSLKELLELTANEMDTATVYRNLDLFEKLGITTRIYDGWKYKVELSDVYNEHHHHMTCSNCGVIIPFEETNNFQRELKALEVEYNFSIESHTLELKGLCKDCC
jgi:Fur family ferric uptake transcriptional regulator